MTPTILLVIASNGYQPVEYRDTRTVLEQAGYKVVVASDQAGEAIAADKTKTPIDVVLKDVNVNDYNGIFFIGGPGALEHLDTPDSYRIIKKVMESGKPFGAICISPRILAKAGALKNKKATGWDGDTQLGEIFTEHGVERQEQDVVIDGVIVTASGPAVAKKFGEAIMQVV